MKIVKSAGALARRTKGPAPQHGHGSSPSVSRRAAFIEPFKGSVLSEVICTSSSITKATFLSRIANDADEPLFCSVFGETSRGLESLGPAEFRIESRSRGGDAFVMHRRLFYPYQRAIVSMRNSALQFSVDAKMPPLSTADRLRVLCALLMICLIPAFIYACMHPVLAFGRVPVAHTDTYVSVPYHAHGIGQAHYVVLDGNRTVSSGVLANGDNSFSFMTAALPRTYVIALHWSGPLATRDAVTLMPTRVVRGAEPPPQIRAIELQKSVVASGEKVVVLYDASADAGEITLVDAAQIAVAHAAFSPDGTATMTAPTVDVATPFRVQLHVLRGGAETSASVGLQVTPKKAAASDVATGVSGSESSVSSADLTISKVIRMDQPFVIGGKSLHLTLVEHSFPLHLTLQDANGTTVDEKDVDASADGVDFDMPIVAAPSHYVVIVTYSSGEGEQTMLLPVSVHPS
jgi:hypothetical protein